MSDDPSQWESSWSEDNLADCVHPLVRAHPDTGAEGVYLSISPPPRPRTHTHTTLQRRFCSEGLLVVAALYLNLNRIANVHGCDEAETVELLNRLVR